MTIKAFRYGNLFGAVLLLTCGATAAVAQPAKIDRRFLDFKVQAQIADAVAAADRAAAAEMRAEVAALAARVDQLQAQLADERRRGDDDRAKLAVLAAAQGTHLHGLNGMTAAGFQSIRIDGIWHRLMIAPPTSDNAKRTGPPLSP